MKLLSEEQMLSKSGRIKGANNVKAFEEFIKFHNQQNDWFNYLISSKKKLRRSVICEECGFSKSVLSQNPLVKNMLKNLEKELLDKGILKNNCLQDDGIDYPDQVAFAKSYSIKLLNLKDNIIMLEKKIALYQSELEKLD